MKGNQNSLFKPEKLKISNDYSENCKKKGNPYIFPGKITEKHLINIEKSWRRIREQAGLEDVRLHDLRRTGSWLCSIRQQPSPYRKHPESLQRKI